MKWMLSAGLLLAAAGAFGCTAAEPAPAAEKETPKVEQKADPKAAEHKAEKPKAPFVYSECKGKDDRLYVFATAACRAHFDKSGEFPEKCITLIGAGPAGETVKFESDEAKAEFKKRHP